MAVSILVRPETRARYPFGKQSNGDWVAFATGGNMRKILNFAMLVLVLMFVSGNATASSAHAEGHASVTADGSTYGAHCFADASDAPSAGGSCEVNTGVFDPKCKASFEVGYGGFAGCRTPIALLPCLGASFGAGSFVCD